MLNSKIYKDILNYISVIFIISFLFLWDIQYPGTQYNIKFFSIFLVPFFFFKYSSAVIKNVLIFFIFIFLHKLYFDNLNNSNFVLFEYLKIITLLFLVLFFINSYKFFLENLENIILVFSLLTIIYFIFFITFGDVQSNLVISCYNGFISQNNFLFKENSHFGFSFIGVFFYSLYQIFYKDNSNIKKTIYLLICIFIFINYSTSFLITCIVISFLSIIYFLKIRKNIIPFSAIFFISVFTILIDKQCNDRFISTIYAVKILTIDKFFKIEEQQNKDFKLDIKSSESSYSLSSVIYVNSFLILKKIITKYPFGVGFDNLKYYFAENIEITKKNFGIQYWKYLEKFNHNDGTNNFVKLFGEFGFLILFLFYFLIKFIFNKNISFEVKLFIIAPLVNQLFFRGAGYFNGGFTFYLIILTLLNFKSVKSD